MAKCRHKVGLLNLRDCGNDSELQCSTCNRPVCGEHLRRTSESSVLCLECFADQQGEGTAAAGDRGLDRLRYRRNMYHNAHFMPYYMGRGPRYRHDDYDTFDDCGDDCEDCGDDCGDDVEASDFQDS